MGTETSLPYRLHSRFLVSIVKLNNPLMGTETLRLCLKCLKLLIIPVKLNNPLMGTETIAPLVAIRKWNTRLNKIIPIRGRKLAVF